MKITIPALMTAFVLALNISYGQSSPGSIRSSWEKADKRSTPTRIAPKPKAESEAGAQVTYPAWESSRAPVSRPWPVLPPSPSAADYHTANTLLIDSLQTLYCVSTNYLRALRGRNESLFASRQPDTRKEFTYRSQTAYPTSSKDALAFLYRELQSLLHNCLHGR